MIVKNPSLSLSSNWNNSAVDIFFISNLILRSLKTPSTLLSLNGLNEYKGLVFSDKVLGSNDLRVRVLVMLKGA